VWRIKTKRLPDFNALQKSSARPEPILPKKTTKVRQIVAVSFLIGIKLEDFDCVNRGRWKLEVFYLNTFCISYGHIFGQGLELFQVGMGSFSSQRNLAPYLCLFPQ
jgi:hypothetical protein